MSPRTIEDTTISERPVKRFVIEGAVIVFSILMAFGIDRVYETARDRSEESIILLGLRDDFVANESALETYVERLDALHTGSVAVVEYALSARLVGLDSLSSLGRRLYNGGSFDARSATLNQIESSGRADLLNDDELRRLISEWRTHVDDAVSQQEVLASWQSDQVWPGLMELGIGPDPRSPIGRGMPPSWDDGNSAVTIRGTAIEQKVRVLGGLAGIARDDLIQALEATQAVLARLEQLLR